VLSKTGDHGTIGSVTTLPSPCTKDCKLDPATGLCRGCLRTIEEIVRWGGATETEKARTLAAVAQRRARYQGEQPGDASAVK